MAITWTLYKEQQAGLHLKSIWVALKNNGAWRLLEYPLVDLTADAAAYVQQHLTDLPQAWNQAATPTVQETALLKCKIYPIGQLGQKLKF